MRIKSHKNTLIETTKYHIIFYYMYKSNRNKIYKLKVEKYLKKKGKQNAWSHPRR